MPSLTLVSEKELTPNFKKLETEFKIPKELIDYNFKLYEIHLKCAKPSDMALFRTALWLIPIRKLYKKIGTKYTNSIRFVPGGQCLPDQFQFVWNNVEMMEIDENSPLDSIVHIKLNNFNRDQNEIVQYPIIHNKQLLGFLLPNSIVDEQF